MTSALKVGSGTFGVHTTTQANIIAPLQATATCPAPCPFVVIFDGLLGCLVGFG